MVTSEYGLIGKKLGHSFSADFFNQKFAEEGIDAVYHLFPLPSIQKFPKLLENHPSLRGLNVTIPYKQEVIPFLNSLSEEAKEIGAVNVIKIERTETGVGLKGFNTDCIGFRDSLQPLLPPEVKEALILGTGGASKAVKYVLEKLGIKPLLVSRSPGKGNITYDSINAEILSRCLLIVNTTPLGMSPNVESYPPLPYNLLTPSHICYDLVYNPAVTEFMKRSAAMGATVKNGLEMLEGQAIAAWQIWNND